MDYRQECCEILVRRQLAPGVFDYVVHCPEIAGLAAPGQFVHVLAKGHSLRRPISICEVDVKAGTLRIVLEVRGKGTEVIAQAKEGDSLDLIAPLGRGFTLLPHGKRAVVVGGGIGTPPLLAVAKHYGADAEAFLGFRSGAQVILTEDFRKACAGVTVCTEDGTEGERGYVTVALEDRLKTSPPDILYACGPTPMLKAVQALAAAYGVRAQLSLEERMGCGVGACLVCACKVKRGSDEDYVRVCSNGPVFESTEVIL